MNKQMKKALKTINQQTPTMKMIIDAQNKKAQEMSQIMLNPLQNNTSVMFNNELHKG